MARRDFANPTTRYSEEEQTNPSANTVLADTGALAAGHYEVTAIMGAAADNSYLCQHRNAANGANIGDAFVIYIPGGASAEFVFNIELATSERFRVLSNQTITGKACAVLFVEKLS